MVSLQFKAALLTLFLACPLAVKAQEICSEKLLSPNIKTDMTDVRTRTYFRDAMCFLDYQKFVDTYGADTGGSYFSISGFGKFNNQKYREAQKKECRDITKEEAASSLSQSSVAVIPIEARALYVECVSRQPLVCVFDNESSEPVLRIRHSSDTNGPTKIRSVKASRNVIYDSTDLKIGSKLPLGDTFVYTKAIGTEAKSITINIKRAGAGAACTAFIAKALTPQTPPPQETTCLEFRQQANNKDFATCNAKTADSYYWKVLKPRIGVYHEGGVGTEGTPECGPNTVGNVGLTARYPNYHLEGFEYVGDRLVTAGAAHREDFNCAYARTGGDYKLFCGQFRAVCTKQ